jgi:hypothetical protein
MSIHLGLGRDGVDKERPLSLVASRPNSNGSAKKGHARRLNMTKQTPRFDGVYIGDEAIVDWSLHK